MLPAAAACARFPPTMHPSPCCTRPCRTRVIDGASESLSTRHATGRPVLNHPTPIAKPGRSTQYHRPNKTFEEMTACTRLLA